MTTPHITQRKLSMSVWSKYIEYLKDWADEHSDIEFQGSSPSCFDEWYNNDYVTGPQVKYLVGYYLDKEETQPVLFDTVYTDKNEAQTKAQELCDKSTEDLTYFVKTFLFDEIEDDEENTEPVFESQPEIEYFDDEDYEEYDE